MIRLAGSLLTTPLTRRLIPRSAFHSVAATSTPSGTSVSLRNVPPIALVGTRAFGTEGGSGGADDTPKPKHDKDLTNIYIQNQRWKQKKIDEDEDFFKKLGSGHTPDYMWIGKSLELHCSWCWCSENPDIEHPMLCWNMLLTVFLL
jgi:hypothetical protein